MANNNAFFGHQSLCDGITKRLHEHIDESNQLRLNPEEKSLNPRGIEEELVVGIFGSWGSGKSNLLKQIGKEFEVQIEHKPATEENSDEQKQEAVATVIPVFFNAWQYEKEPQLILPLIKHIEIALEKKYPQEESQQNSTENKEKFIKKFLTLLKNFSIAIASSTQGKVGLKINAEDGAIQKIISATGFPNFKEGYVELNINPKDFFSTLKDEKNTKENQDTKIATAENNLYYDINEQLRNRIKEANIHLLFLIDDLDRCLPEKALQMLETIKLFFAIPWCSFILAVDDEVVERGIAHRYRDYFLKNKQKEKNKPETLPITGAEYLEKIIHLPVRLNQATEQEMQYFLIEKYPKFFDTKIIAEDWDEKIAYAIEQEQSERVEEKSQFTPSENQKSKELEQQKDQWLKVHYDIGILFAECIPPQPRKLIRAAELLQLKWSQTNHSIQTPKALYLLAKLTLIQLFAPEVYRICARNPVRFSRLADWHASEHTLSWLYQIKNENVEKCLPDGVSEYEKQQCDKLSQLVANLSHNRSEFSLQEIFDPRFDYYRL